ncbi:hypothetical protein Tco_0981297 [Tanacetum coccineum]
MSRLYIHLHQELTFNLLHHLSTIQIGIKWYMTRWENSRILTPYVNLERQFRARKDITPMSVHNIFFYKTNSSESESKEIGEVDIETLVMEQYLEVRDNIFFGNKDDDAYEHVEKVLEITSLFSILGVSKDAIMLRVGFFILDIVKDDKVPIILGRPMLATAYVRIDVFSKKILLEVGGEKIMFNANEGIPLLSVTSVCAINNFQIPNGFEEQENLEEFLMNDEINVDLGDFFRTRRSPARK